MPDNSFLKSTTQLLVGDYVRLGERIRDKRADSGFYRVEHLELLDGPPADAMFNEGYFYGGVKAVALLIHGVGGIHVLREQDIEVLDVVDPEREARERREPYNTLPSSTLFAGGRSRTAAEQNYALQVDRDGRSDGDPAQLYPTDYPDPERRRRHIGGVEGLRRVAIARLPWPHRPSRCKYRSLPQQLAVELGVAEGDPLASAALFASLSPEQFAACQYHDPDWAAIGDLADQAMRHPQGWQAGLEALDGAVQHRLSPQDRSWLDSLFHDPVIWEEGHFQLTNGQHRLCGLRAAGVLFCPADGLHLPDDDPGEPIDAREQAVALVQAHTANRRAPEGLLARLARQVNEKLRRTVRDGPSAS